MLEHIAIKEVAKIAEVAEKGLDALPLVKELGKIELTQKDIDNADKPLAKDVEKNSLLQSEHDEADVSLDNEIAEDLLEDETIGKIVDDNGEIYITDGKLLPNSTYELNGNIYTTDDRGRIVTCTWYPNRCPDNNRDLEAQKSVGGENRKPTDQGGHIVARDLGGDSGIGNMLSMDSKINQSDYKRMENDIKSELSAGKEVAVKTEITYSGDSERPDRITTTVTSDGKETVYVFDNTLDGEIDNSLISDVPQDCRDTTLEVLDATGGSISSIKIEYNENGGIDRITTNITYTDSDGSVHRGQIISEGY